MQFWGKKGTENQEDAYLLLLNILCQQLFRSDQQKCNARTLAAKKEK